MTKLEQEILAAMAQTPKVPVYDVYNSIREHQEEMTVNARAAAEVAKKFIEKALRDAADTKFAYKKTYSQAYNEWLKENGII